MRLLLLLWIGNPFLIGTVALGGAINILPIIFAKIHLSRRDILLFLFAVITGLFVVWILNVLWCYYILLIVPQTATENDISLEEYFFFQSSLLFLYLSVLIFMWLCHQIIELLMFVHSKKNDWNFWLELENWAKFPLFLLSKLLKENILNFYGLQF